MRATRDGDPGRVREALGRSGVDINATDELGRTSLHLAVESGKTDLVALLLDHGADKDQGDVEGRTALYRAVTNGRPDVARLLLERGANPDSGAPLCRAAAGDRLDLAELLLRHGAQANTEDAKCRTPLHLAVAAGHIRMVSLLLRFGCRVDPRDSSHETPLHRAAAQGLVDIAVLLLAHGADANVLDAHRQTPLHLAAAAGSPDVVRQLLDHGARIETRDIDGRTAEDLARVAHAAAGAGGGSGGEGPKPSAVPPPRPDEARRPGPGAHAAEAPKAGARGGHDREDLGKPPDFGASLLILVETRRRLQWLHYGVAALAVVALGAPLGVCIWRRRGRADRGSRIPSAGTFAARAAAAPAQERRSPSRTSPLGAVPRPIDRRLLPPRDSSGQSGATVTVRGMPGSAGLDEASARQWRDPYVVRVMRKLEACDPGRRDPTREPDLAPWLRRRGGWRP